MGESESETKLICCKCDQTLSDVLSWTDHECKPLTTDSDGGGGAEVTLDCGVSGADCMRQARLLDEIVFKGNDYEGDRTVRAGVITLLSKRGLQVQIKVAVGQRPEQTFVKWDKVLKLRQTH